MMMHILLFFVAAGIPPVLAVSGQSWHGWDKGLTTAGRTLTDAGGTMISHNFDDGSMGPFIECTTTSPNYAEVVDGRVKTYWTQTAFDESRSTRGAEFCDGGEGREDAELFRTQKEGWMGWTMNIDPGHSRISESAIAQVFQFDHAEDYYTWTAVLKIQQGALEIHTRNRNTGTQETLMDSLPFGEDLDIILGWIASSQEANNGMFQVWVNGEQLYNAQGISFGFGQWNENDELVEDVSYITYKNGMYNYDDSTYTSGEERIVWYDNLVWYSGPNGFDAVNPAGKSSTPPVMPTPDPETIVESVPEEDENTVPVTLGAWLTAFTSSG